MQLHEVNRHLEMCGYAPLGEQEVQAIAQGAGPIWLAWLVGCSQLQKDSAHWGDLRAAVMAVSVVTSQVLRALRLTPNLTERVQAFLRVGKPLRAAVTVYLAQVTSSELKSQAAAFIGSSMGAAPQDMSTSIERKVHRVYGTKAAVTFEYAKTRDGRSCLQVEGAGRDSRSQGFNWSDKIILQFSDSEAMQVLAVLRNWLPSVEFANHGAARDKRMTLTKQAQAGYLVSIRQATVARVVPLPTFEAFKVVSLIMRVLGDNSPHLDPAMIAQMCQEMATSAA
ncbi:hypothetical protein Rfer_4282 (plasmid) [Rhodoferax ferrireducens T118]|uniref:Uncharacterized protein n=1 Tax=Albidiferax ferrireducens (strain ATCC BAA-621 / DSM 15236 / T118) TaxID=338969 RepID=Q21QH6_ALBFT|nr:hypothetical protein [Rhodoferax ferrireducens]ABD71969.1 hypothetical protein Rfer_4282 [Rhodoferax ferrireducens T118]